VLPFLHLNVDFSTWKLFLDAKNELAPVSAPNRWKRGLLVFDRICKWPNLNRPNAQMAEIGQIKSNLLWIRPISPCNRLAKKELLISSENFHFFQEKSRFLWIGIFRNFGQIFGFRPFEFRPLKFLQNLATEDVFWGAHFNLETGILEQLKGRMFKILKIISWIIKILKIKNLERSKSWKF
jgi:hypothetical protein